MATRRESELAEALAAVRSRLSAAAEAAGRDAEEIELLPVTKFFPAEDVIVLRRLGCEAFGESREQEASNKAAEIGELHDIGPIRWHMVGRIQRNKARSIASWAFAAHSVDSRKLIEALSRAAGDALTEGRRAEPLRVFIQLSLDGDESRGGVDINRPDSVDELCAAAHAASGLKFTGLMAIPPLDEDADASFARVNT
ncbi:MAG TPA: alanine racemase, partial [Mycobacterium sp.]|nr:alanine racemase [Mycobacterium sp.]